jgi:hypothetical protein
MKRFIAARAMATTDDRDERRGAALRRAGTMALAGLMAGCTGAPSFAFAGAYFPAWLACALAGVAVALAAHIVFVAAGLAQTLPLQLFVCVSVGAAAAALAWLAWTGV